MSPKSSDPNNVSPHSDCEKVFFERLRLIDDDLELCFIGKDTVSAPDTALQAYRFVMVHVLSREEMGGINIKAGYTENIINFRGNIGFTVYEAYRGRKYSSRSCILLIPVIKYLNLNPIWFTCNIDNYASKKNIESLGALFSGIMKIPEDSPYSSYYPEGAKIKLRYKWEIV